MPDFVTLSLRAAELATRPVRLAIGKLVEFVTEDAPAPPAPPRPAEPRFDHEPEPEAPSHNAARRAARHEPTKGEAAAIRAQQREAEWGDEPGPGANIVIDERLLED